DAANRPIDPGGVSRAVVAALPAHTMMLAPSPNPAPGATTLAFSLAERGDAELAIYSVDGRRVRRLAHGARDAGAYRLRLPGRGRRWPRAGAGGLLGAAHRRRPHVQPADRVPEIERPRRPRGGRDRGDRRCGRLAPAT